MPNYFPITEPINTDAELIRTALITRSEQLKSMVESQGILKTVTMTGTKVFGSIAGIVAASSLPAAGIMFAAAPLAIGGIASAISISCLALYIFLDPKSPNEIYIRDLWKSVFLSLKNGNGQKILKELEELVKQKEERLQAFEQTLGGNPASNTLPFFHKIWFVAYLQIALDHLKNDELEEARSNAHLALSHFEYSKFPVEVKNFTKEITEAPQNIQFFVKENQEAGDDLHALDYFIALKKSDQNQVEENNGENNS